MTQLFVKATDNHSNTVKCIAPFNRSLVSASGSSNYIGHRRASLLFAVCCAALLAAGESHAQLASISPFPGQLVETFESFSTSFTTSPLSIMNGAARIETADSISIYDAASWIFSLGSSSENAPRVCALGANGPRGVGIEKGFGLAQANIIFTSPVNAFGAFWGAGTSETNPATITVEFVDVANQSIGVPQTFTYLRPSGDGALEWHGWSSDVPIAAVRVGVNGPTFVADDLRATLAPHISSISRDPSGKAQLIGYGVANQSYTVQANEDLNTANWTNIGVTTAGPNGAFQFEDALASNFTTRFYRLVQP
jgi:hypothetical protein